MLVLGACDDKPAAGGKCSMADHLRVVGCQDAHTALLCRDMRLETLACKGPRGCAGDCDRSLAEAGDPCISDPNASTGNVDEPRTEVACTRQGDTLVCSEGRLIVARHCRGPKGCSVADKVQCDQSVAGENELCDTRARPEQSCSVDRKAILKCTPHAAGREFGLDGKHSKVRDCPTKKGCEHGRLGGSGDAIWPVCDFRDTPAGGACGEGNENLQICSPDGAAILKCDDTRTFVEMRRCEQGSRCAFYEGFENQMTGVVSCK
jgi:hypothetical protein